MPIAVNIRHMMGENNEADRVWNPPNGERYLREGWK